MQFFNNFKYLPKNVITYEFAEIKLNLFLRTILGSNPHEDLIANVVLTV